MFISLLKGYPFKFVGWYCLDNNCDAVCIQVCDFHYVTELYKLSEEFDQTITSFRFTYTM